MKEAICIQVTFISENKRQKEHFFIKIRPYLDRKARMGMYIYMPQSKD